MSVSRREFVLASGAVLLAPGVLGSAQESVQPIVETIRNASTEGQAAVVEALRSLTTNPGALLRNLGEPSRGGIQVLYNDAQLTILNIVWAPLMVLRPHDHNMWASIGVYTGREDNIYWERTTDGIKAKRAGSFGVGEVGSMGPDGVHSVVNPIDKLTAAIHVYGGDFFAPGRTSWAGENHEPQPFNQEGLKKHFEASNARFGL